MNPDCQNFNSSGAAWYIKFKLSEIIEEDVILISKTLCAFLLLEGHIYNIEGMAKAIKLTFREF